MHTHTTTKCRSTHTVTHNVFGQIMRYAVWQMSHTTRSVNTWQLFSCTGLHMYRPGTSQQFQLHFIVCGTGTHCLQGLYTLYYSTAQCLVVVQFCLTEENKACLALSRLTANQLYQKRTVPIPKLNNFGSHALSFKKKKSSF